MRTSMITMRYILWALAGLVVLLPSVAQQPRKPNTVKIVSEKSNIAEGVVPLDPKIRIAYQYKGGFEFGADVDGRQISRSITSLFMIDGNIVSPMKMKNQRQNLKPLPEGPGGKKRHGGQAVWEQNGVRVTMTLEGVPGKRYQPQPGAPSARRMDTLLVKYTLENTSNAVRKIACRAAVDNSAIGRRGLRYHSPITHPKQTLLGVTLEKKDLPPFIEALEKDDLQAPGFKGVLTFKLGGRFEGPGKIVLTRAGLVHRPGWDIAAEPGGISVCVLYWEPRDLLPQAKRELAFAYGQGIALANEGAVSAVFSGSFDLGQLFTVTAYVDGPIDGQSLTLQLPEGMERVDGNRTQMVPPESEGSGQSVVVWRCRVLRTGTHPIAIRSNNGVTQTWNVTVSPPN